MSIWGGILDVFAKPAAEAVKGWQARKTIRTEHKLKELDQKHLLKIAKIEAEAKIAQAKGDRAVAEIGMDFDYDQEVLRGKGKTWVDEFLIVFYMVLFAMHFHPFTQKYMAGGWEAMGYEGVPQWFTFIMLGIAISTLGLFRLFRLLWTRKDGASK